ncbi:MAG: RNA polymerase sigma factor [Steroidobacteraceae bacterium]
MRGQSDSPTDLHTQLGARFRGPLMSFFLRRIGNHEDAEDLTQETLLRVIAAANLQHIENADSFVFKVAMNLLHDRGRQTLRQGAPSFIPIDRAVAGELESDLAENLSPERVLLGRDSLREALKSLEELGERTYDIFVLFRLENMKQKEIAALYGISQSSVEKHVLKAMLHLATRYGRK